MKFAILIICLVAFAADDVPPVPATPKRPVTDEYHGVKVVDDYRWLETASDPEVRTWSDAQNTRSRAYLDRLPMRAEIAARLKQLYTGQAASFSGLWERAGVLFALETKPPLAQPMLVTLGVGGGTGIGKDRSRPERARHQWIHQHGLVRAVARRETGCGFAFKRRKRGRDARGFRDGHRQTASRFDRTSEQRNRGRQRCLES